MMEEEQKFVATLYINNILTQAKEITENTDEIITLLHSFEPSDKFQRLFEIAQSIKLKADIIKSSATMFPHPLDDEDDDEDDDDEIEF